MHLERLRQTGAQVSDSHTGSEADLYPTLPDGFDLEKFNRGRKFFQDNVFSCALAMLGSLISGMSVINLLRPLVFTEQSNSPKKAITRYIKTFQHVMLWHFGNVWDASTEAFKSVVKVRTMHNSVRKRMMENEGMGNLQLSQYDMSLVQCGFMGAIVMYPESVGIQCTKEDLSDYCYFWYGLGYLLGITDENNICCGGLSEARSICKEIEQDILLPALRDPPEDFYPMAKALTDGMNMINCCRLFSVEAFLALSYSSMSIPNPKLGFADWLRLLFLRLHILFVRYVPYGRWLMNKLFSRIPKIPT